MKLKDYREDLLKRLVDPTYAAEYLAETLESGDDGAFLIALKDVVDAGGGVSKVAKEARLTRPSLYKVLSKKGNPTLETLQQILKPLGLRVSTALDETA
jgi:probable addiction module antidote protein